jgi:hypothetical protein
MLSVHFFFKIFIFIFFRNSLESCHSDFQEEGLLINIREYWRGNQKCTIQRNWVFCVTLLCVFMFWVPWCDVHYDFHVKTMFVSSLPSVVCRRAHVLFTLFVFVCASWCPRHIMFVCFVCLCLVYPVLPVSLDCTFLIAPSIFSNVY